jgi:hypothetical protein
MPNFGVPVPFPDLTLNFLDRAGINHHGDISTFRTNNMIVVLLRIEQFVVTARPVQMDFLSDLQTLKKSHYAKHRGVVRSGSLQTCSGLNFIERERLFRLKQGVQNLGPIFRDSHAMLSQQIDNCVARKLLEWGLIRMDVPSHRVEGNLRYRRTAFK